MLGSLSQQGGEEKYYIACISFGNRHNPVEGCLSLVLS